MREVIIKVITFVMICILLVSISCIDTEGTPVFFILCGVSLAWLWLVGYANNWFERM
jgi:hypothetical protein